MSEIYRAHQPEFEIGLPTDDVLFNLVAVKTGLESCAGQTVEYSTGATTPENEDKEPRTSAWAELGGRKYEELTLGQERAIVGAGLGSGAMKADVKRAAGSLDNAIKYGLSGEIIRTYEQQASLDALAKLARDIADARELARALAGGQDLRVAETGVAARRKAKEELRLRAR